MRRKQGALAPEKERHPNPWSEEKMIPNLFKETVKTFSVVPETNLVRKERFTHRKSFAIVRRKYVEESKFTNAHSSNNPSLM